MMMNEEIVKTSLTKNLDWLENLKSSLRNLQIYETVSKLGGETLTEFLVENSINPDFNQSKVQEQNLLFFLNESNLLITNSNNLISPEIKESILKKIKFINLLQKKSNGFLNFKRKFGKIVHIELKNSFFLAVAILPLIRQEFVKGLWSILTPNSNDLFKRTTQ